MTSPTLDLYHCPHFEVYSFDSLSAGTKGSGGVHIRTIECGEDPFPIDQLYDELTPEQSALLDPYISSLWDSKSPSYIGIIHARSIEERPSGALDVNFMGGDKMTFFNDFLVCILESYGVVYLPNRVPILEQLLPKAAFLTPPKNSPLGVDLFMSGVEFR